MKVFTKIVDLQAALSCDRKQEAKIGFVPTMGALHAGHASLVERSVKDNDVTVVSIFLNPIIPRLLKPIVKCSKM